MRNTEQKISETFKGSTIKAHLEIYDNCSFESAINIHLPSLTSPYDQFWPLALDMHNNHNQFNAMLPHHVSIQQTIRTETGY